jgi:hypothetical protein
VALSLPALTDLLQAGRRRALHLEMRDEYEHTERYAAWLEDRRADRTAVDSEWSTIMEPLCSHGADLRRMRIVSEPWSAYIRYEYDVTQGIIAAGERVRWLPRDRASDLRLPGNDFWIVDDRLLFNITGGDGRWVGLQANDDPGVLAFCLEAFEAAWARGIDHSDYKAQ